MGTRGPKRPVRQPDAGLLATNISVSESVHTPACPLCRYSGHELLAEGSQCVPLVILTSVP
jgi:hypothetical protein